MIKVYGDIRSGNCYKIKLLLTLLNQRHFWQHVDIMQGESRTPAFLKVNPNGKIPAIEWDDGQYLFESNAILYFLAQGTPYWPSHPVLQAQALQWMFFEQYSHEPFVATSRYICLYLGAPPERAQELLERQAKGYAALMVLEQHLQQNYFMVGDNYSIADIALYAYTHVAEDGGILLDDFPAIQEWIVRMENHPRHLAMRDFLVTH